MVIRRINSFFSKHHRIFFGVLAIFVVVMFVFYFSSGSIFDITFSGSQKTGLKVFGKDISANELQEQTQCSLIELSLMIGPQAFNQGYFDQITRMAPKYLGLLAIAEERGIECSPEEVDNALIAMFSMDGKYSADLFNQFCGMLNSYGMTAETLREAVRRQIIINKLNQERYLAVDLSYTENLAQNFSKYLNSGCQVTAIKFPASSYLDKVTVTDAELESYYNANPSQFLIPPDYSATLAVIKFDDPQVVKDASKQAEDEAKLKEYFENNIFRYGKVNEDGSMEDFDFEKVRSQVIADFMENAKRNAAIAKANNFAVQIYEQLASGTPSLGKFTQAAEQHQLPLVTTSVFQPQSSSIGLSDGTQIAGRQLAAILSGAPSSIPLSEIYVGDNAVYIGYVTLEKPEAVKDFALVKDEIVKLLTEQKALQLARQTALNAMLQADTAAAGDNKAKFEQLSKTEGVVVESLPVMNINQQLKNTESVLLLQAAMTLTIDELSQVINVADGAVIVRLDARPEVAADQAVDAAKAKQTYLNNRFMASEVEQDLYISENILTSPEFMEQFQ